MKKIYFILLFFVPSLLFAENKDITIMTNDSLLATSLRATFTPVMIPAIPTKDSIEVTSSNPNIVEVKYKYIKSGDLDSAIVKNFGTVWINIKPKGGKSNIQTGFKIMVKNSRKTNTNNLGHGMIVHAKGQSQFAENGQNVAAKLSSLTQKFYTRDLVKESESVRVTWDIIPDKEKIAANPSLTNDQIIQFYNSSEDSTSALLKVSGNHIIILVATDGTRKDTISSFKYTRIGLDYMDAEYITALNAVKIMSPDKMMMVNAYTDKPYVKNGFIYQNVVTGQYSIIDTYLDTFITVIDKDTLSWAEDREFTDTRPCGVSHHVYTYKYRRFCEGLLYMTQNLTYFPDNLPNSNIDNSNNDYTGTDENQYYRSRYDPDTETTNFRKYGVWYHKKTVDNDVLPGVSTTAKTIPRKSHVIRQGPCPEGWRMPSIYDITEIFGYFADFPETFNIPTSNLRHNVTTHVPRNDFFVDGLNLDGGSSWDGTGTGRLGFNYYCNGWYYQPNLSETSVGNFLHEAYFILANPGYSGNTRAAFMVYSNINEIAIRGGGWVNQGDGFYRVRCVKDVNE
jgi:uncharacterized protein (TIGR02145 family)